MVHRRQDFGGEVIWIVTRLPDSCKDTLAEATATVVALDSFGIFWHRDPFPNLAMLRRPSPGP